MTQLLFIEFFYTTWGKVLTYLLLLVVPFFTLIGIERMDRRRPIGVYLLLALWLFVSTFERDLFDCNWLGWAWLFATLGIGIGSAYIIGPSFDNSIRENQPYNYILTSLLNTSLITSIIILCEKSDFLPFYIGIAFLYHFVACEYTKITFAPIFSLASLRIIWLCCDFNHWYVYVLFTMMVFLQYLHLRCIYLAQLMLRKNDHSMLSFLICFHIAVTLMTFFTTLYSVSAEIKVAEIIKIYPYWTICYIILFITQIIGHTVTCAILSVLVTLGYIMISWQSLYFPFSFTPINKHYFSISWGTITLLSLGILSVIALFWTYPKLRNLCLYRKKCNNSFNNDRLFHRPIKPTLIEAAIIAEHVYGNTPTSNIVGGWQPCFDFDYKISRRDNSSGLLSQVYKKIENGNTCVGYIYAYAGTDFKSFEDWRNNIMQTMGFSDQYWLANMNSKIICSSINKGDTLTFVGHSLGGGLAALSAMSNNNTSAITFNAAGVSKFTKEFHNVSDESRITAILSKFDPLNMFQTSCKYIMSQNKRIDVTPANGKIKIIKTTAIDAHSIKAIIKALK